MPDWRSGIRAAIAGLNLEPGREEAIVEELAQHISEKFDDLLARGVSAEEAHRQTMEELNEEALKENLRPLFRPERTSTSPETNGKPGLLSGTGRDLRLGLRLLRSNPGFALVAILSLALGIGANTAIFQLLDAVLLRTLPVSQPQQLADVQEIHEGRIGNSVARQSEFSFAIWDQLRRQQRAFSDVAAWSTERFDLGQGGVAHYAEGLWVSGSFFHVLQVNPVLGRLFSQADDYRGCGIRGAVLSYAFWQQEFGGRANALGSRLLLDGQPFEIIGVTPPGFYGLEVGRNFDVALPVCTEPAVHGKDSWTDSSTTWWLAAIGRLNPGWTLKRASAQLASIAPGVFAATLPPEYDSIARKNYLRFSLKAEPAATGVSSLRQAYEDPLWVLLAISGLILFIACANLANLMLARASTRRKEMALRLTLGASRSRLIRQLLVESLLLAMIGTILGAILAQVLSKLLIAFISNTQNPVYLPLYPDLRVLAFTIGVAVLTCLLFGVAPAIQAASADPGAVMKAGGRGLTAGRERFLLRRGLIISQVALSLVLLIAALLFVRTFRNLLTLNVGFQQNNLLAADFDASALNIPVGRRSEYKQDLLSSVRNIPGVRSAAETVIVPLSGDGWNQAIDIPGTAIHREWVYMNESSAGYFQTLEAPLLAGRDFGESDTPASPPVAIVNEAFVRKFLGNVNPIGRTFGIEQPGAKPDKIYQIIGEAGNTKYRDLRGAFVPIICIAESQDSAPDLDSTILIRSNDAPSSVIASLKSMAEKISPSIVLNFSVLRTSILDGLVRERLMATLSAVYGVLAAVLSMVGIYGIISYMVIRRRKEIGVRIALGATRGNILAMIMRETLTLLVIGLAAGTVLVIAAGRAVQSMLFGLKSTDPAALLLAIAGMAGVTLAASLLPAQRAAAVQPMETLREE